jgi:NTE family protein
MLDSSEDINKNKDEQSTHRVLIFQGGGALGAYEVGVYEALYDNLIEESIKQNKQLFDIVAGTSAGAINATLIVNHVLQNKNESNPWKGSVDMLHQFWESVSTDIWYLENDFIQMSQEFLSLFREQFNKLWNPILKEFDKNFKDIREQSYLLPYYFLWPDKYGELATNESFRRYWSWYHLAYSPFGIPNVLSPLMIQPDFKFLNPFNFMVRYDNTPLTNTIGNYWDYKTHPIKTDEREPRLLLVAVDVQDATTVTFDSYAKMGNQMMSIYGDDDGKEKHVIHYNDGIKMEHLLTTMSSHLRYKFPELDVAKTINENMYIPYYGGQSRPFMDGFYLSNTPLREVLQAHRDYWYKIKGLNENIPSLDIYIGDLYPTKEKGTPDGPESINNRVQNILYHDKSKYDEKVAAMISDYIYIIRDLIKTVNGKGISEQEIYHKMNSDLKSKIRSFNRKGGQRSVEDLINGRITINRLQRIGYGEDQNLSDSNDISGKAFDFSKRTIKGLIDQGYKDTCKKCKFGQMGYKTNS